MILILKTIIIILPLLISVAYFTIAERKIMGSIQIRKGPNTIGFFGLLQPLSDGAKLFSKEIIILSSSDEFIFLLAPLMSLFLSIMGWAIVPFGKGIFLSDLNLGVLYTFLISALNVYSLLFAGWSSNSKYSFLGAIRSVAQMISYEIAIGFSCLILVLSTNSFNLSKIVIVQESIWFLIPFFPVAAIFCISILAETNRHPFDLPESESELVSGYNVEYSGIPFAQFFLGEYSNMLLMSVLASTLFFGGFCFKFLIFFESIILGFKISIGVIYFIINRAIFPRYRYDQLMELSWKCLLSLIFGYLLLAVGLFLCFNAF
jgi:NADH-quinone oxidoreductase subunit H